MKGRNEMDDKVTIFLFLIFITIFLLSQIIVAPSFGTSTADSKRLKRRLKQYADSRGIPSQSLVKEKYLKSLSPLAQWFQSLPGIESLNYRIEQAGSDISAAKLLILLLGAEAIACFLMWHYIQNWMLVGLTAVIVFIVPFFILSRKTKQRMARFEDQLPEALDMMVRALKTGYPFNECMSMISEEMEDPLAHEFGLTFEEINYGRDITVAFDLMIDRMPSVNLIAMVTSILIQRESGGNLSEVLMKIANVLRSRIRFQRKIKTLAAEGVISAWVLAMLPFALFLMFNIIEPDYFDPLYEDPDGFSIIGGLLALQILGGFWARKIIHIDV